MTRQRIPGIKIPYFHSAQYPEVEGLRCIEIMIPDDPLFLPLLAGLLKLPCRASYYQGDYDHNGVLSQMWRDAYDANDWGECMNCEDLTACIQPLLDNQTANFLAIINQSKYGDPGSPGVPLTPTQTAADLAAGSNPTCDLDIIWAQCMQIVTYTDILITDAIQLAESATNDIELLEVVSSIPGLDELGIDAVFGYIEMLTEGIAENYAAQITEAYLQEVACQIFCECQDCEINLDRLLSVMHDRMLSHFSDFPEAFFTVVDMLSYFVDSDIDGTIIADALFYIVLAGGALANTFLGDVGTKPLSLLLKLAVNDANDDWMLICEECPVFIQVYRQPTIFAGGFEYSLPITIGVPFELTSFYRTGETGTTDIAFTFDGGQYEVEYWVDTGTFEYTNDGETAWLYTDENNVNQSALSPAQHAGQMASPVTVRSDSNGAGWWYMNNGKPADEDTQLVLQITLNLVE